MAKTMRHAFGAALKIDEVAIPTSGRGGILRSTMKNLCKHQTTHQEPKGKTATRCTRFLLAECRRKFAEMMQSAIHWANTGGSCRLDDGGSARSP
jgi:hypothetical protein